MCGIAGVIDFENKAIEPALLLAMNKVIAHRGPDDEGYTLIDQYRSSYKNYSGLTSHAEIRACFPILQSSEINGEANIGLCHRRFSIIDLSAAGHQPFFDKDCSCCVAFNGEIYNYIEVRDELISKGVIFHTHSDTEVLLEAYKYWDTDCFSKLNGFWALALYDFKKKQLLISRDRIGKKPLYWTKIGSRIYFSSEIKALLQIPEVHQRRQINERSLYYWVVHGRKDLNFNTFFEDIYSLPSASWAVLKQDFPNDIKKFWAIPEIRMGEQDVSVNDAAKSLRDLLEDSIKIRLRADVPLSIELSGGMDSSTLVALSAQIYPSKITSYTVRFPDKKWNEEPFALSVAEYYNVDYRVLDSPTENFWSQILPFTYLEEEPYHSPNLETNQVIWSQMRSMGTKVSLNGAGGDENFAGYGGYYLLAQMENLGNGRINEYLRNALFYSAGRTKILALSTPILRLAKERLLKLIPHSSAWNEKRPNYYIGKRYYYPFTPLTLSEGLLSDMTNTLMPYWLRSGDRGYMGIPLEVRAPFLDYRIIDFAFTLPVTYLVRNGWHKWILRKAVQDLLPKDVVWRKHKLGFPFPYERFYSEYDEIIETILDHSENPYIDFSKRKQFRNDWKTISFILWYELFFNENLPLFNRIETKAREMHPVRNDGYSPEFLNSCNFMA